MKTTAEKIAIMQAYVDGKDVEFKISMRGWIRACVPDWDWHTHDYRIAQQNPPETLYIGVDIEGNRFSPCISTQSSYRHDGQGIKTCRYKFDGYAE